MSKGRKFYRIDQPSPTMLSRRSCDCLCVSCGRCLSTSSSSLTADRVRASDHRMATEESAFFFQATPAPRPQRREGERDPCSGQPRGSSGDQSETEQRMGGRRLNRRREKQDQDGLEGDQMSKYGYRTVIL